MTSPVLTLNSGVTMPASRLERLAENIDILDFNLSSEGIGAIDAVDTVGRGGAGPELVGATLSTMSVESHYAQPTP